MSDLGEALERSREMIREALVEAKAELEVLRARHAELELQVAAAEAALGGAPPTDQEVPSMTLHEAIAAVLRDNGNEWMAARQLADAVNTRGLYRKRDGTTVEVNQIHARTNNYGAVFEKDGSKIRLREESPMFAQTAHDVSVFQDDDRGFFAWLAANPDAYFINTERNPRPTYLVLHRPPCRHFKGEPDLNWTKDYVKVCSADRAALEEWASDVVGGEVTLCRSCFGG